MRYSGKAIRPVVDRVERRGEAGERRAVATLGEGRPAGQVDLEASVGVAVVTGAPDAEVAARHHGTRDAVHHPVRSRIQQPSGRGAIGRQEGARLVLGGNKPDHLGKGYFVEPTIFDNVEPGMRIFKEEIFGPVLAVSTAKTIDEALAFANGVEYGLTTSIFTENIDTIMRFVEEVETGMVHVNEPTIGGEAQLPFGGTKATGVGEREMAEEGLNFFTELKTVFINYSGKAERLMIR